MIRDISFKRRLMKMSSTKRLYNFGFFCGKMVFFSSFVMQILENSTNSRPTMVEKPVYL